MTTEDLIKTAMEDIGVLADGETPDPSDLDRCLKKLQSMLRLWSANKINVFATTSETKVLTSSQSSYTWGTGGNISTTRPHKIVNAFIRDTDNSDWPIEFMTKSDYQAISDKSGTGMPSLYYYDATYPLGTLYLNPAPDIAYTLHIDSLKPFVEVASFDAISSTFSFPPEYEEPVIANLCIRIAPRWGKSISTELAAIASSGLTTLKNLNASNQRNEVRLSIPTTFNHRMY